MHFSPTSSPWNAMRSWNEMQYIAMGSNGTWRVFQSIIFCIWDSVFGILWWCIRYLVFCVKQWQDGERASIVRWLSTAQRSRLHKWQHKCIITNTKYASPNTQTQIPIKQIHSPKYQIRQPKYPLNHPKYQTYHPTKPPQSLLSCLLLHKWQYKHKF